MISQTLFSKFIPYFDYKYIKCYPPVECCSPLPMLSPENRYTRTHVQLYNVQTIVHGISYDMYSTYVATAPAVTGLI